MRVQRTHLALAFRHAAASARFRALVPGDDIRFNSSLAGGTMMDVGGV
jgi:hypothetical protein